MAAPSQVLPQQPQIPTVTSACDKTEIVYRAIKSGRNVLLHGMGGSGKSYALRRVIKRLIDEDKKKVACTASTGCSAVGYSEVEGLRGSTIHHWFGVGRAEKSADDLCKIIASNRELATRIRSVDILAIDEISMISGDLWSKLDAVSRRANGDRKELPFGGIQIVACGDFMQLPPVSGGWVFERLEWKECNFLVVKFDEPHRFRGDAHFHDVILRARFGKCTPEDWDELRGRLVIPRCANRESQLEDVKPTKFFSYRREAATHNAIELANLSGQQKTFVAIDTITGAVPRWQKFRKGCMRRTEKYDRESIECGAPSSSTACRGSEILDSWADTLEHAIPRITMLKVGAQVMLKKNIAVDRGLVNGSRGIVESISSDSDDVTVKFANGIVEIIGKTVWTMGDANVEVSRTQIPLILAWGLTIHASQGATLDKAECDVSRHVFAPGQAYVALSRVRTMSGLTLSAFDYRAIRCDPYAQKYVESIESTAI